MRPLLVRGIAVVLLAGVLGGCATSTPALYSWGAYEDLIYTSYREPGKLPAEAQVERLEQDRQIALAKGRRLPPGWHAHLGVLYYQLGKLDQAVQELNTEKAEFPEATVFVDRLLGNLKKS